MSKESNISENKLSIIEEPKYETRLELAGKNYREQLQAINIFFRENPNLKSLDLSNNDLYGDQCATEIMKHLKSQSSLTSLNLSNNKIQGDYWIKKLSEYIGENTTLISLDASYNEIGGDSAAEYLGGALALNKALKILNLSHNDLGGAGDIELINSLASNLFLTHVDLSHNNLGGYACVKKIAKIIRNNTVLLKLDISHNMDMFGVACANMLEDFYESNKLRLILDEEDSEFISMLGEEAKMNI